MLYSKNNILIFNDVFIYEKFHIKIFNMKLNIKIFNIKLILKIT